MMAVLNKRWLSQGWRVMDPKDCEPMALTWIEALDREMVPHAHYNELYRRSIGLRARRMEQGLKCDDFSVDMMLACWPGLRSELRQEEINRGRTLPVNAESVCEDCFGTGFKRIQQGAYKVAQKCDHSGGEGE